MKTRKFISPRLPVQVKSKLAMWWLPDPRESDRYGELYLGTYMKVSSEPNVLIAKPEGEFAQYAAYLNSDGRFGPEGDTDHKLFYLYEPNLDCRKKNYFGPISIDPGQSITISLETRVSGGDQVATIIDFSEDDVPDKVAINMSGTFHYTNKTNTHQHVSILHRPVIINNSGDDDDYPTATVKLFEDLDAFSPTRNHQVVNENLITGRISQKTLIGRWEVDNYENVSLTFTCGKYLGNKNFQHKVNITSDQSKHIVFPEYFQDEEIDVTVTATVFNNDGIWSGFNLKLYNNVVANRGTDNNPTAASMANRTFSENTNTTY